MSSVRLYQCLRCHQQVMICQQCDRGQRYCAGECRHIARKISCQRANKKYQNSRQGRFNNAERQSRFRYRKNQYNENKQKVTDQGSPSMPVNDLLIEKHCPQEISEKLQHISTENICHFCGCPCGPFFRGVFLKKRTTYPYQSNLSKGERFNEHQQGNGK